MNEHDIAGWAALTPVSSRCVYAGVAVFEWLGIVKRLDVAGLEIGEILY